MEHSDELILCKKWPDINADELIKYYNEIKQNKKLLISDLWINPGRLDPKLVNQNNFNLKKTSESAVVIESDIKNETITTTAAAITTSNDSKLNQNKFDLCDEFTSEIDKEDVFKLNSATATTRREVNTKKIACIDKIFDDMRKNFVKNAQHLEDDENEIKENQTAEANVDANFDQTNEIKIESIGNPIATSSTNDIAQIDQQQQSVNVEPIVKLEDEQKVIEKPQDEMDVTIESEAIQTINNNNNNVTESTIVNVETILDNNKQAENEIKQENEVEKITPNSNQDHNYPFISNDIVKIEAEKMLTDDDSTNTGNLSTNVTINDSNNEINAGDKANLDISINDYINTQQEHELNVKSNDALMSKLKEDEEELINYRKNNFNTATINEESNDVDTCKHHINDTSIVTTATNNTTNLSNNDTNENLNTTDNNDTFSTAQSNENKDCSNITNDSDQVLIDTTNSNSESAITQ